MRIEVIGHPFDPWREIVKHSEMLAKGSIGATAAFVGSMRDFNEGDSVLEMMLDHYEGMTQRHLESLASEMMAQYELTDLLMMHRVGRVTPGEAVVVVAVWSAHRAQAFAACEQMVEDLKSKAPFWKKETLSQGGVRWVENNTASRTALYGYREVSNDSNGQRNTN